jgi:hypothetical protein
LQTAQDEMATLDQYSEVVAAYGYTLPPPPKAQTNRMVLGLLYAAIGTALGTMTGTGMAVVSMQPGGAAAWAHHLSLPDFSSAVKTPHAASAPVVAHHATPAPAPATVVAHAVIAAPAQAAPAPVKAASAAPAAAAPVAHPGIFARVVTPSVVEASVDTAALDHQFASHHAATKARLAVAPVVHHQAALALASASSPNAPPAKLASLALSAAVPVPSVEPVSLDDEVKPAAIFYSEGDATVVDYDSALDTILTNDGRTFVVGPTVAMSSAASWDDYRSNVHYRCDQGGKCTITRSGVLALNAKQI